MIIDRFQDELTCGLALSDNNVMLPELADGDDCAVGEEENASDFSKLCIWDSRPCMYASRDETEGRFSLESGIVVVVFLRR